MLYLHYNPLHLKYTYNTYTKVSKIWCCNYRNRVSYNENKYFIPFHSNLFNFFFYL